MNYFIFVLSGSANQMVKVIRTANESECISTIRHHDGFIGQRIGPVSSMCFHPHRVSINSVVDGHIILSLLVSLFPPFDYLHFCCTLSVHVVL